MTYRIEITADSLDHMKDQVWALCVDLGMLKPNGVEAPRAVERDVSGLKSDETMVEPTAKRRGRPPKEKDSFGDQIAQVIQEERAHATAAGSETTAKNASEPIVDAGSEAISDATGQDQSTSAESSTELTYDDVRKRVLEISKLGGRDGAMSFLASLGVDNAQKLHQDQWQEACDKADVLLEKLRKEKAL